MNKDTAARANLYRQAAETQDKDYQDATRRLQRAMAHTDTTTLAVQVLQQEIYRLDRERQFSATMAVYYETAALREDMRK